MHSRLLTSSSARVLPWRVELARREGGRGEEGRRKEGGRGVKREKWRERNREWGRGEREREKRRERKVRGKGRGRKEVKE